MHQCERVSCHKRGRPMDLHPNPAAAGSDMSMSTGRQRQRSHDSRAVRGGCMGQRQATASPRAVRQSAAEPPPAPRGGEGFTTGAWSCLLPGDRLLAVPLQVYGGGGGKNELNGVGRQRRRGKEPSAANGSVAWIGARRRAQRNSDENEVWCQIYRLLFSRNRHLPFFSSRGGGLAGNRHCLARGVGASHGATPSPNASPNSCLDLP
uniref:Uncharacterized protein n=1 Tax=Oryza sativa subsp. japonica TaxID=39947 RepID=Q6AU74_ORYSJ|nr:hypothetical protein [Oryza sativa Japonica Group]